MNAQRDSTPTVRRLPAELVDVAFLDIRDVCAAVRMSASWVHEAARTGLFPAPVVRQSRCTRWRSGDVRIWLIKRAASLDAQAGAIVDARAKKASAAAKAKRAASLVYAASDAGAAE